MGGNRISVPLNSFRPIFPINRVSFSTASASASASASPLSHLLVDFPWLPPMRICFKSSSFHRHALDVEPKCTIRSLKAVIQDVLCLSDEGMEQRLLVIDGRDYPGYHNMLLQNCWDLLDGSLPSSTPIAECGVEAGTILFLGFKGPFLISIESPIMPESDADEVSDSDDEEEVVSKRPKKLVCTCPETLARWKMICEEVNKERPPKPPKPIEIEVSCLTTIREIKPKIEAITGEPLGEENFPDVFLSNEDRPLIWFGIYRFTTSTSPIFTIYRSPDNTHHPTPFPRRLRFCDYFPDPDENEKFQIVLELPNPPWRSPLMCGHTDTIGTMRKNILNMKSFQLFGQTFIKEGLFVLFFRGTKLGNESSTLDECGIKNMDSIEVFEDSQISIDVFFREIKSNVCVESFGTVGKIKAKIQEVTGIPEEKQRVYYKGWWLEDRDRRLVDYSIGMPVKYYRSIVYESLLQRFKKQYLIYLLASDESETTALNVCHKVPCRLPAIMLQITIEIPNSPWRFPLWSKHSHTIRIVREGIIDEWRRQGELSSQSYIKEGKFVLVFDSKQIEEEESATLGALGIKHMDSIQLYEEASISIAITAPERSIYKRVVMLCFDTIGLLKDKLEVVTGIPKDDQNLAYENWFLDDNGRRLVDYGISKQVPKNHRINVATSKSLLKSVIHYI